MLETIPEISETLVIGVEQPDDGYWLGLFVVPVPGHALDDELKQEIVTTLRTRLTPGTSRTRSSRHPRCRTP